GQIGGGSVPQLSPWVRSEVEDECASGLRGAERHAPAAPYLVSTKNNSDGTRMKSRSAFEFTVRKMLRQNRKLYFWTFTLREVHSLREAMQLWNQFLTVLKRK